MSEREEIRLILQTLSDSTHIAIEANENERESIRKYYERNDALWREARNNILAGIGFGIGILISLIAIEIIERNSVWYILVGIIIGIVVFFSINSYLFKQEKKFYTLDAKYQQTSSEILTLMGQINALLIYGNPTREQAIMYSTFIFIIGETLSYELGYLAHDIYNAQKPENTKFQVAYNVAKIFLTQFKTLNLPEYHQKIESFIKQYEENQK